MNQKGFTLIEVILVIAIISIIAVILMPNIFVLVSKNKEKSCHNLQDNIISATKIYTNDNKYDLDIKCYVANDPTTITYVSLRDLVESGDLKSPIINPMTDEEISLEEEVKVMDNGTNKEFSYNFDLDCE